VAMATRPEPPVRAGAGGQDSTEIGRERAFALLAGAILVVLGLAGSLGTPLIGGPQDTTVLVTGPGHDIAHLVMGALYLHVGLALDGRLRADGLIVLGAVILIGGLVSLVSSDLFGLYGAPTSVLDQLAHLALGVISIAIGAVARSAIVRQERRTSSRSRSTRRR
jgi:hypothetical protein